MVGLALLAYTAVRGLTEGEVEVAYRNADQILRLEAAMGLDFEHGLQSLLIGHHWVVTLANWVYIWAHWPALAFSLIYLAVRHRDHYFELRNALFISGAIGLVIFATYAVSPPRLFAEHYVDTVTESSAAGQVLQPPALVNKFAAVPSFHFGWNLLLGLVWYQVGYVINGNRLAKLAAFAVPAAMAFAVIATANHWTFDVLAGGSVAMAGLAIERKRPRQLRHWLRQKLAPRPLVASARRASLGFRPIAELLRLGTRSRVQAPRGLGEMIPAEQRRRLTPDLHESLNGRDGGQHQHQP